MKRITMLGMTTYAPDNDDVRTHLGMMQSVINRMAENSRSCKTWAVTLVAAILVVMAKFEAPSGETAIGPGATWIAVIPAVVFWMLDSYYLALERAFRSGYVGFVKRLHRGSLQKGEVFKIERSGPMLQHMIDAQKSISLLPFYVLLVAGIIAVWSLAG